MLRAATMGLLALAVIPAAAHSAAQPGSVDDTIAAIGAAPGVAPVLASDCDAGNVLRRLSGCSALIKSGTASAKALSYAYSRRGMALFSLGEKRRAIEDFNQAIGHDPQDAALYLARGTVWQHLGEHEKAVEDLSRAIELDPDNAAAHGNLGVAWEKLGDDRKALESYDRSLVLDPENAIVLNNRGNVLARLGERHRAIADYDHALELDPGYASAYYNRAGERCLVGEAGAAVSDYLQAIRLGERQRSAMEEFLSRQGYFEEAPEPASSDLEAALRRWSEQACAVPANAADSDGDDEPAEVLVGQGSS